YDDPLRIEFLGDTIESVRFFDQSTQKSTAKPEQAWILPAREFLHPEKASDNPPPIPALDQPAGLRTKAEYFWRDIEEAYFRHGEPSAAPPYPTPDRLYLHW